MRLPSLVLCAAAWLPAHAHEGHGLPGTSHWHAADVWLMLAAAVVVALLVWARRKP